MSKENHEPLLFIGVNLPEDLVERIKGEARRRAFYEARRVPYVEIVRDALLTAFPAPARPNTMADVVEKVFNASVPDAHSELPTPRV